MPHFIRGVRNATVAMTITMITKNGPAYVKYVTGYNMYTKTTTTKKSFTYN